MIGPRSARRAAVLATAALGVASFLGACASASVVCGIPVGPVISMEILDDGSVVVQLDRTPERALAAARAVSETEPDLRFGVEWGRGGFPAVRIAGPIASGRAQSLAKRIADEAERR